MSADDGSTPEGPQGDTQEADAEAGNNQSTMSDENTGASLKRKAHAQAANANENGSSKRVRVDEDDERPGDVVSTTVRRRLNGKEDEPSDAPKSTSRSEARMPASPVDRSKDAPRRPSASGLPGPEKQRPFSQEEKTRGKRLFGGLLSTLSQTTANSQQKKRLEIERRQQERANQQKIEDDKRRAERLSRLDEIRRIEQVKFDEQVMHTRHSNMLAVARCLRTRAEPKLCYLPWELTQEQRRKIDDQVASTKEIIEREVREHERENGKRPRELGVPHQPTQPSAPVGEQAHGRSNVSKAESTAHSSAKYAPDKDHDERDMMVETEEDTVLY